MMDEEKAGSGELVDDLIRLDTVKLCPDDELLYSSCPLFCVKKLCQPGQWCIIVNCPDGSQNDAMGKDPVTYCPTYTKEDGQP